MSRTRAAYDDVVVTCPATVPYVRYSIRGAHWFLAGALAELLQTLGSYQGQARRPVRVELHAGAGQRGRPDAASRTDPALARSHSDGRRLRHRRAAPRGARGAIGRRRRGRLHCRRHQSHQLVPAQSRDLQPVRARCRLSVRLRRRQCELRFSHRLLHADLRRDARGFRQDLRRAARQRAEVSAAH